jgi:autophagy-related protein 16
LSPLGLLATAHFDGHVRLWALPKGELLHDLSELHSQQTTSVDFSADNKYLLTNCKDSTLKLVDLRDFSVVREFSHAKYAISSARCRILDIFPAFFF